MPYILWQLQGEQVMNHETTSLNFKRRVSWRQRTMTRQFRPGGFMVWMGEPMQEQRKTLGFAVLAFLAVLFVFAYKLKKEYWKDIH